MWLDVPSVTFFTLWPLGTEEWVVFFSCTDFLVRYGRYSKYIRNITGCFYWEILNIFSSRNLQPNRIGIKFSQPKLIEDFEKKLQTCGFRGEISTQENSRKKESIVLVVNVNK